MTKRAARQPVHRAPRAVDASTLDWPKVDDAAIRVLPPVLRAVVRALGWGGARDFLVQHGGLPCYIPEGPTSSTLGLAPTALARLQVALAPHLSSTRIVAMPKPDKMFLRWRDEQFARDMHHMSNRELARKYKITARHALNLKRACLGLDDLPATRPGQTELF